MPQSSATSAAPHAGGPTKPRRVLLRAYAHLFRSGTPSPSKAPAFSALAGPYRREPPRAHSGSAVNFRLIIIESSAWSSAKQVFQSPSEICGMVEASLHTHAFERVLIMSYKGFVFAVSALAAIAASSAASADYYYSGYDYGNRTFESGYGAVRPSFWGYPALDMSGGRTRVLATYDEIQATREYNDWRYGPFNGSGYRVTDRGVDDYGRNYFGPYLLSGYRDYDWRDYGPDYDYAGYGEGYYGADEDRGGYYGRGWDREQGYGRGYSEYSRYSPYSRYNPEWRDETRYSSSYYREREYERGWSGYREHRYEERWGEERRGEYRRPGYGSGWSYYRGAGYGGGSGWGD